VAIYILVSQSSQEGEKLKNAWMISFIRIPLLFIMLILFNYTMTILGLETSFPFLPDLSTISFTIVNVICLMILIKILKGEKRSLIEIIGFQPDKLGKDILYGFLWLFILYIPFVIAVMGTMFLMFGTDFINHFETVFAGDVESFYSRPIWLSWLAACVSLIFPFLNAPIEEIMFRGYAQPKFIAHYQKVYLGIVIPAVGFSLQHMLLAASVEGAIVYAVAFFVWGIGSGIIYYKQKRLLPLIVCHFIVNIAFSLFPIIFLLLGVY
jgi:uncharacterized protein